MMRQGIWKKAKLKVCDLIYRCKLSSNRSFVGILKTAVAVKQAGGNLPNVEMVYRVGVDKSVASVAKLKSKRLKNSGIGVIVKATRDIDPVLGVKLGRLRDSLGKPYAFERVARVLVKAKKYDAARYWVNKIPARAKNRRSAHDMMIDILVSSNKFDELELYLQTAKKMPRGVRGRALAELGLRLGSPEMMKQGISTIGSVPRGRRYGYYTWLRSMIIRMPGLPVVIDEEIKDALLASSAAKESQVDAMRMAALLRPKSGKLIKDDAFSYLRELENLCALSQFEKAADLSATPPTDLSNLSTAGILRLYDRRLASVSAVGGDVKALAGVIARTVVESDNLELIPRLFRPLISWAPQSELVLSSYERWGGKVGWGELETLCRQWAKLYCSGRPMPKPRSKRCFIVANGPSISGMPLHLLEGEDVFIMNRGYEAIEHGLPIPRFIVVSDLNVYRDYKRQIDNCKVDERFISGGCLIAAPRPLPVSTTAFGAGSLHISRTKLVPTLDCMHHGSSVVVIICQLAHLMGYEEINILGVDLDYSGPTTHFYGSAAKEARRLGVFRVGDAGAAGVNAGLANVAAVVEPAGSRLWNVGRGGHLTVLPRRDFESLFQSSLSPEHHA